MRARQFQIETIARYRWEAITAHHQETNKIIGKMSTQSRYRPTVQHYYLSFGQGEIKDFDHIEDGLQRTYTIVIPGS